MVDHDRCVDSISSRDIIKFGQDVPSSVCVRQCYVEHNRADVDEEVVDFTG